MDFQLKTLSTATATTTRCDALIVLFAKDAAGDDALSRLWAQALKDGDVKAQSGRVLSLYRQAGVSATHVVLAGIGDGSIKAARQAAAAAVQSLKGTGVRQLLVHLAGDASAAQVSGVVTAVADASYVYTATKSKAEPRKIEKVTLSHPASSGAGLKDAFERAVAAVRGIETAKEWGNRPANHATPSKLAEAARGIARGARLECEVLGPREVARLGMGSFMAVAQGTDEPLRFIVMRYKGAAASVAPTVLVGKGITFDTGGISLKPAPEMDEMKFDMCGAASVLGVFRALAELKPAINVVGLIPSCENMPGGRAVKPGDVVTSMSGQTIEILNTDAEGRLILCDSLTYAERFKPAAVIDIATLTGACVIALGGVRSGMFASDDALAQALQAAGDRAHDLCWRMPLDDDYAEGLKTHFADVANVGGRPAGAITAAKFLQRFASRFPWAHLDIAGTAWKGGAAKGATGRPVGLLLEYLLAGEYQRPAAAAEKRPAKAGRARKPAARR